MHIVYHKLCKVWPVYAMLKSVRSMHKKIL